MCGAHIILSDKFNIGHYAIKVKVTKSLPTFSSFTAIQTTCTCIRYKVTLVHATELILCMYVSIFIRK